MHISSAKAKLLVDYPLFGTIASKLKLKQNDDIQSFKSDGITLEYNSDFLNSLTLSEMEFVLANGAMHASLAHEQRRSNRSGWLWQMATDFAINDMLVENGMDRPELAQYRVRFKGMYAEEIYAELKDDILREDENLEYEADDVNDINPNESHKEPEVNFSESNKAEELSVDREEINQEVQAEIELAEQLFEEFANTTIKNFEKVDELPLHVDRFFHLNDSGKIDWQDELRIAIDKFHKDDYTLFPPNKKFIYQGIYIPSNISNKFNLVVAIDSSGSIDEKLLDEFLSELNFLMSMVQNYQIELFICDEKIHTHKTLYSGENLEVNIIGGGATDFRPVFDFVKNELQDTKLLLYFTDLEGTFPNNEPTYSVKWIVPKEQDIPFGELIVLD